MKQRKKILVLAYALSPYKGSEFAVGWNYISEMSKDHDLTVILGTSDDHIGEFNSIDLFVKKNPDILNNVEFIKVKASRLTEYLNYLNKRNIFNYTFYFAYNNWHRDVYKKVRELHKTGKYDLIHYLEPIGYREPGYLWKLNIPYIWGPIEGTYNRPISLLKKSSIRGIMVFLFRDIINWFQLRFSPKIRRAIRHSNVIIAATKTTQLKIDQIFNIKSLYLPENGINNIERVKKDETQTDRIRFIWVGSIDSRKNLNYLLEILHDMDSEYWNLSVIGDGPLKTSLMEKCNQLNLADKIDWLGKIPREKVYEEFSRSDMHIITSLSEANTTVVFEAMSLGVPTITLDHCGMKDTICDKCGVKIPISSYDKTKERFTLELDSIVKNRDKLLKLQKGVLECAQEYTWIKRKQFFNNVYDLAINNWVRDEKDNW